MISQINLKRRIASDTIREELERKTATNKRGGTAMWKTGLAICAALFIFACGDDGDQKTAETTHPAVGSFVSVDLCKGVLLTVAADGISETALSQSIETRGGFNGPPSWSPDGRRFAIAEGGGDHGLWVMKADGTEAADLVHENTTDAYWSPDGQRIAYTRLSEDPVDGGIHVINPDGTDDTKLTDGELMGWSADSSAIVYSFGNKIFTSEVDGPDESRELFSVPDGAFTNFRVSPDGSHVAWINRVGFIPNPYDPGGIAGEAIYALFVASMEGDRSPKEIFRRPVGGGIDTSTLSFSPDSKHLAFVEEAYDGGTQQRTQFIDVIDVDGGSLRRITSGMPIEQVEDFPLWSADGTQIVVGGFVIPVDGSGEKKLTSDLHLQCPSDLSVRPAPSE